MMTTYYACETEAEKDYAFYERIYENSRNRRCIDGRITGCGNCVGYCRYAGHSGFLTEKHRSQHNCIEKGCFYYVPKAKRPKSKRFEKLTCRELTALATQLTAEYEGMRVMGAAQDQDKCWTVRYVTITNEYPIEALEKRISESIGEVVTMFNLNYDFERAASLIFKGQ